MNIIYNIVNNNCFNDTNGSIEITNIDLSEIEQTQFLPYTIKWYGNLSSAILSQDNRILTNLRNGLYSFQLENINNPTIVSDLYNINISSPDLFILKNIYASEASCGNNGYIQVFISGGQPPYTYSIGALITTTTETSVKVDNLTPGIYPVFIQDANNCAIPSENIEILDSLVGFKLNQIVSPKHTNDYGGVSFDLSGNGPFTVSIISSENTENDIKFDLFNTTYLNSIIDNTYNYTIDKIYPGLYNLIAIDRYGCEFSFEVEIPNITEITTSIDVSADTTLNTISINNTLPIYDTLLVPFSMIVNNSIEWNYIKKYNMKNYLPININGNISKFLIARTMLDKYCLDSNKIEVLRLGNTSKDWFFYLQLAPGINLDTNPELIDAKIELNIDNQNIPITLGLNNNGQIDSHNISLIKGSFMVSGFIDAQFINTKKCYISISEEINDPNAYDFMVENINISMYRQLYAVDIITTINFLENFNSLISYVGLNENFCNLTTDEYKYFLSIKKLLKIMNSSKHINNLYIYAIPTDGNGSIIVSAIGQEEFYFINETIKNLINIEYYYFNNESKKALMLLRNNESINLFSLYNIKNGFYILRIKDKYNNITKNILNNNVNIDYQKHYTEAKQYIQNYNSNIFPFFTDGDILVYVSKNNNDPILDTLNNIPTINKEFYINTLNPNSFNSINNNNNNNIATIKQTNDPTNTTVLTVKISPSFTKCIIKGPNNYILNIDKDTKVINMVPGVYTIIGDEQDLFNKQLYQSYNRILLDNMNEDNIINIKFESYKDKILIKE